MMILLAQRMHQLRPNIGQAALLEMLDSLELIPGVRLNHVQADCCGIAGTYGYKK